MPCLPDSFYKTIGDNTDTQLINSTESIKHLYITTFIKPRLFAFPVEYKMSIGEQRKQFMCLITQHNGERVLKDCWLYHKLVLALELVWMAIILSLMFIYQNPFGIIGIFVFFIHAYYYMLSNYTLDQHYSTLKNSLTMAKHMKILNPSALTDNNSTFTV